MKLGEANNLSFPGRIIAAVILAACGLASIFWAVMSSQSQIPTLNAGPIAAPLETELQSKLAEEPPAQTHIGKLDVNTATAAELELLPGVGPALSKRIVEYREKNGPFANLSELDKVQGIGPKMLEKIRPLAEVRPAG